MTFKISFCSSTDVAVKQSGIFEIPVELANVPNLPNISGKLKKKLCMPNGHPS